MSAKKTAIARLLRCKAFLVDMDGTIYVDEQATPGAVEFIAELRKAGRDLLFVTNNSSRHRSDYCARLASLGIATSDVDVMTSGDAMTSFLIEQTHHRSAYVVGTDRLRNTLREGGIDVDAKDPACVVAGFDDELTYEKLRIACSLLMQRRPFYATHPDRTCITSQGLVPDVAAVIGACEAVTGVRPTVIGKPEAPMVELALERLRARAETTAVVGDQLDTDMTMARRHGMLGVLVMTGETTPQRLAACVEHQRPELIVSGLVELRDMLRGCGTGGTACA